MKGHPVQEQSIRVQGPFTLARNIANAGLQRRQHQCRRGCPSEVAGCTRKLSWERGRGSSPGLVQAVKSFAAQSVSHRGSEGHPLGNDTSKFKDFHWSICIANASLHRR
jgi:hypothetical protein